MPHRKLKEIVGDQELLRVTSDTPVRKACENMQERHVTAVLIIDDGALKGIFTKRDLLRRIVVAARDPDTTPIGEVMTPNPFAIDAERTGFEAVRTMREEKTRHIVVSGLDGDGYGVVSMRDILSGELAAFENELEFEKRVWEEI